MHASSIGSIIRVAWRRRYFVSTVFLVLLPASMAIALLAPRQYQATALIMLQESASTGSAGYQPASELAVKVKVKGLEALLQSEWVLANALVRGVDEPAPKSVPLPERIEDLRKRLVVRQIADNFVQIALTDYRQEDLGNKLNIILTGLFEALLAPTQSATDALSFVVRQRRSEIEAIEAQLRLLDAGAPDLSEQMQGATGGAADERARELARLQDRRNQLQAEAARARANYAQLIQHSSSAAGMAGLNLLRSPTQIRVVDMPADPTRPLVSRLKLLLLGLAACCTLSIGAAALAESLDPSIKSAGHLAALTGLPVLAQLDPSSDGDAGPQASTREIGRTGDIETVSPAPIVANTDVVLRS